MPYFYVEIVCFVGLTDRVSERCTYSYEPICIIIHCSAGQLPTAQNKKMAAAAAVMVQLRFSPLSAQAFPSPRQFPNPFLNIKSKPTLFSHLSLAGGGGGDDGIRRNGGGGRNDSGGSDGSFDSSSGFGVVGAFVNGWRSRVTADPQFPFKVLMEELVGVSACVLGDMATRPNFGLNELDFVFSTLVVGCILNFTLMYLLAPTSISTSTSTRTLSSSSSSSSVLFATCPKSHMFEPGPYGLLERFGTLVYKGAVFAGVGLAAGLVGTAISNGLIMIRKKMDPGFETANKAPPTLLNAVTWAGHMGVSSNLRYQSLNGIEFVLDKCLPPLAFKSSVFALRLLNNVLGGMTFVLLARLTGSQKAPHRHKGGGGGDNNDSAAATANAAASQ